MFLCSSGPHYKRVDSQHPVQFSGMGNHGKSSAEKVEKTLLSTRCTAQKKRNQKSLEWVSATWFEWRGCDGGGRVRRELSAGGELEMTGR